MTNPTSFLLELMLVVFINKNKNEILLEIIKMIGKHTEFSPSNTI